MSLESEIGQRVAAALWDGAMTRRVSIGTGALENVADCFGECFGNAPAVIIADTHTYAAAGKRVHQQLVDSPQRVSDPVILQGESIYAEYSRVEQLRQFLAQGEAVPIAVGSGTINDLVKLASGECGRPYMSVATAASMDGYTSFGASVTRDGHKQTLPCPAPLAVVVDLDVLAAAPARLNAAGFADLLAKVPAGADWLVADALEVEPVNEYAWQLIQHRLPTWLENPTAIRNGDRTALAGLIEGLIMTGLAMQYAGTTRPASGAEHQFSHLWDMQHHTHNGSAPLHGEKVAIGSIASAAMYERVVRQDRECISVDTDEVTQRWPSWEKVEATTRASFDDPLLADQMVEQQRRKYITTEDLLSRLKRLQACWSELQQRLGEQLFTTARSRQLLAEAGAPHEPEQIGISRQRLHESHRLAQQIRNRFTVLDLVNQAGWWEDCVDSVYGNGRARDE